MKKSQRMRKDQLEQILSISGRTTEYYQCIQANRAAFKLEYRTIHSYGVGEPRHSMETYERANGRGVSAPAAPKNYQTLIESSI
jgi:hypothetical protein